MLRYTDSVTVRELREILAQFPDEYDIKPDDYDVYLDGDIDWYANDAKKVVYYGYAGCAP